MEIILIYIAALSALRIIFAEINSKREQNEIHRSKLELEQIKELLTEINNRDNEKFNERVY